jgi:hypothetical protein
LALTIDKTVPETLKTNSPSVLRMSASSTLAYWLFVPEKSLAALGLALGALVSVTYPLKVG